MITTDFVAGQPCWLDLGAPDVGAAAEFYGTVFGWEYTPEGGEGEGHGVFRTAGRVVAALGPLTERGARSAWLIYFRTTDADEAARAVRRLGGTVRVEPFDADGRARLAQFADPAGTRFAVWQAGRLPGVELVGEPVSLNWIELCTSDVTAAKEFYGELFGWWTRDIPLPGGGGTYSLIAPGEGAEERTHGGMVWLPADSLGADRTPYWHPVFTVSDCDRTAELVAEGGGSVVMGPENAEGVGRLAVCLDQAGAEFVVLRPEG
ncbi:VOC family protein [Actinopolyspora erythraea]|uniref:Hydroxylase n=1 Tax=Actinopolyspora erythraea TaxID=414996 RepID=A0A099D5X4_9ACTN|nr:VOC family protein [Actinopolyspora erythraea]ASU78825.1 VOC family protein [Actinopolyspora erythraea]KGI81341.1 hydroxylase [Actinopolyspora erythraea]